MSNIIPESDGNSEVHFKPELYSFSNNFTEIELKSSNFVVIFFLSFSGEQ